MTYTCRPFYSMQKILASGNCDNFHRKFGKLTEGKRGVYIWGFAKEDFEIPVNCDPNNATMKQFEVQVSSENIGIYYVGKVESENLNIFERIMQERANLFGGFSPIFEWDTYFHNTPMLHMHSQLGDKIAREEKPKRNERLKKHMTNLDRYEKCSQNKIFNSTQAKSPIIYSNSCFNENNLFDITTPGTHYKPKLKKVLQKMSRNFIFTWIELDIQNQECEKEQEKKDIKKLESELINCLGVNVFGIDSKYTLSFTAFNSLKELKSVKWQDNPALEDRIKNINTESLNLKKSHCGCFK